MQTKRPTREKWYDYINTKKINSVKFSLIYRALILKQQISKKRSTNKNNNKYKVRRHHSVKLKSRGIKMISFFFLQFIKQALRGHNWKSHFGHSVESLKWLVPPFFTFQQSLCWCYCLVVIKESYVLIFFFCLFTSIVHVVYKYK